MGELPLLLLVSLDGFRHDFVTETGTPNLWALAKVFPLPIRRPVKRANFGGRDAVVGWRSLAVPDQHYHQSQRHPHWTQAQKLWFRLLCAAFLG